MAANQPVPQPDDKEARREEFFAVFERIGAAFADEDPAESDRLSALALQEAREQMRRERAAKSGL